MEPSQKLTEHHKTRLRDYLTGYARASHYFCDTQKLTLEGIRFARESKGVFGGKSFGPVMSLIEEVAKEIAEEE